MFELRKRTSTVDREHREPTTFDEESGEDDETLKRRREGRKGLIAVSTIGHRFFVGGDFYMSDRESLRRGKKSFEILDGLGVV